MYIVLDKYIIETEIVPNIPLAKRGFPPTVSLTEIVNCILYKLKTGVHWEHLPVSSLFSDKILSYQAVFYHYRKWCKSGVWKNCRIKLLQKYKSRLDLSSSDLDGSHTRAIRGGEEVGYQGRKKKKNHQLFVFNR